VTLVPFKASISLPFAALNLLRCVEQWSPDAIYQRFSDGPTPIARLARRTAIVAEVNSDARKDLALLRPPQRVIRKLWRSLGRLRPFGWVVMTHELKSRLAAGAAGTAPIAVVSNGVDFERTPWYEKPTSARPRLLFVGTGASPWYGVDKMLWLAKQEPHWDFDLVGPVAPAEGLPANVRAHGALSVQAYFEVARHATAALGSLAWHRADLSEACPLKVREYLAMGIPTIIAYDDVDFPSSTPFILRLDNYENNVKENTEAITTFVDRAAGMRVERRMITNIDIRSKERQRLAFIRECADAFRR
jgi:hypothetical protein